MRVLIAYIVHLLFLAFIISAAFTVAVLAGGWGLMEVGYDFPEPLALAAVAGFAVAALTGMGWFVAGWFADAIGVTG